MKKLKTAVVLISAALALAACSKSEDKQGATQVAAKVNAGEITVHQINFALQRIPGLKQEQIGEAKKQVLDNLITQELAVQQAIDEKLDRDPNVQQMIEAARRDILAKAFLEQATKNVAKPSPDEIKKYYAEHPELFSARKIFRIEEIGFNNTPEALALANELISQGKTGNELIAALKAKGIEAGGGITIKPAEQIPLELLPKIAQSKEGQPQLINAGTRSAIFTVLATKAEPISETTAQAVIEQFITNKAKSEQVANLIKQLKEKAKIEYKGDFSPLPPKPSQDPKPSANNATSDASMAKGIAGLK